MKPAHVWSAFGLCAAVLLAALVWISASMLRLERAELAARAQATLEENTRLALWRLDSALMPLLARESSRPSAEYAPEPAGLSPLFAETPPEVWLHFQVAPGEGLTSPQVPPPAARPARLASPARAALDQRSGRLKEIRAALASEDLAARLPREPAAPPPPIVPKAVITVAQAAPSSIEKFKNVQEFNARQQAFQKANVVAPSIVNAPTLAPALPPAAREGALTALWIGDALVLARRVGVGRAVHVQGCWLDWPRLRAEMLASIEDLLPGARLEPAAAAARPDEERRLATLPVRLVTGGVAVAQPPGVSPTRLSLAGVWACALLATLAVGVLLRGVMELSERRRIFVSAVTHELRTPLTTFRLYTDMLAEDMVPREERRREYVSRLRAEAERLGHLVENVLFYARVETGRAATPEVFDLALAVEEMRPRLAERAARAGLDLDLVQDGPAATTVRADRAALEQVLLNLVDNACKYAAAATPSRIEMQLSAAGGRATVRVRDHGPGLSPAGRSRLFRPFSKSDREAAHSAPGIGLGLALSRRLARAQGGELSLESSGSDGAVFALSLPLAESR